MLHAAKEIGSAGIVSLFNFFVYIIPSLMLKDASVQYVLLGHLFLT